MSVEFAINGGLLRRTLMRLESVRDKSDFSATNFSFFGFYVKEKSMDICARKDGISAKINIGANEDISISEAGNFSLFGKNVSKLVSKFPDGQVTVVVDEADDNAMKELGDSLGVELSTNAIVTFYLPDASGKATKNSKNSYTLVGDMSKNNIPSPPEKVKGKTVEINMAIFSRLLEKTSFAASFNEKESDINFRAARLEFSKDGVTFVATDGTCLALSQDRTESYEEAICQLYAKELNTITQIVTSKDKKLVITIGDSKSIFKYEDVVVNVDSAGNIDKYANYKMFTDRKDEDAQGLCTVKKTEFAKVLGRIAETTDCDTVFHFSDKECYVKTEGGVIRCNEDLGEAITDYSGEDGDYIFNYEHLSNSVKLAEEEVFALRLFGSLSPVEVKFNDDLKFIILPLNE